jgi:hypothetical protein
MLYKKGVLKEVNIMNIKKVLVGVATSTIMLGVMAAPVFASNSGDGSDYGTQPGYDIANSNTVLRGTWFL